MILNIHIGASLKTVVLNLGYKLEFLVGRTPSVVFFKRFPGNSNVLLGLRTIIKKIFMNFQISRNKFL